MMRVRGATILVAAVLMAAACGNNQSGDPGDPNNTNNTPDPNAMPPVPTGNGLCNEVAAAGATITDVLGAAAPTLNGGAMVDGRYVLTKYEWYTPNQLHTRSITMVISGGGRYGQYLWQRDQEPEQRVNVNIAVNGGQLAMKGICPVGSDLEWDRYGVASDGGLILYSSRDSKAGFFARQ
jgi:hypothetical protein